MRARFENRRANFLRRLDDEVLSSADADEEFVRCGCGRCGCGRWQCDGDARDESPPSDVPLGLPVRTPSGSGVVVAARYGHVAVALGSGERLCFAPTAIEQVDVVSRIGELGLVAQ